MKEINVLSQASFAQVIEQFVKEKKCSYMDAVVLYCEENNLDIESAAKLLSSKKNKIRQSIELEASDLNLLKEKICSLPGV